MFTIRLFINWCFGVNTDYHAQIQVTRDRFAMISDDLCDIITDCKQADDVIRAEARALKERQVVVVAAMEEADALRDRILSATQA